MNATNNSIARVLLLLTWIASNADALAPITAIPKAPPSRVTIGNEAYGNCMISELVYDLVEVVKAKRERKVTLTVPPGFPIQDLSEFENESLDLAGRGYNGGNGLKFSEIFQFLAHNAEAIKGVEELQDTAEENINHLREMDTVVPGWTDNTYLSTFRSVDQDVSCVYAVLKDTMSKRLTVVFCGSRETFATRDWLTNFNVRLAEMETPERIKDNMKGQLQKRLLIHKGHYKYLFDNRKLNYRERPQRFDQITEDLKSLLEGEDGYSVFVTGHSLGGALSHITALKLAGAGDSHDFLPRPVTCVSLASPFSGTGGYRRAFEQAELGGLLRCLRVNNREDIAPGFPPFSIGFSKKRLYKHTGMNLRLKPWGVLVEHSSKAGAATAVRNFLVKPSTLLRGPAVHSLPLHMERLKKFTEAGRPDLVKTLEEHYKDKDKVGKDFFDGKAYSGYSKDEEEVLTAGAEDIALSESE